MAEPEIEDAGDDAVAAPEEPDDDMEFAEFDGSEGEEYGLDEEDDGEFEVGTADLGIGDDEDIVAGFDGVDDDDDSGGGGGGSESSSADEELFGEGGPSIEDAINGGLARASAYGLPERQQDEFTREMREIAEAAHVGFFGEKVVRKYGLTDVQDIPPEVGLAVALVAFAAVTLHKRPDGDDIMRDAMAKIRGDEPIAERFESDSEEDDDNDE